MYLPSDLCFQHVYLFFFGIYLLTVGYSIAAADLIGVCGSACVLRFLLTILRVVVRALIIGSLGESLSVLR